MLMRGDDYQPEPLRLPPPDREHDANAAWAVLRSKFEPQREYWKSVGLSSEEIDNLFDRCTSDIQFEMERSRA